MRNFVGVLVAHQTVDFFRRVGDKQFAAGGSYVTAAIFLEHLKFIRVLTKPLAVPLGFRERALELRIVREFFDDDWVAHRRIISGLTNPVN